MQNYFFGLVSGLGIAFVLAIIWAALVISGRTGDIDLAFGDATSPDPAPAPAAEGELAELRQRLASCQHTAEQQRQRADYYYELFCDGARANAKSINGEHYAA